MYGPSAHCHCGPRHRNVLFRFERWPVSSTIHKGDEAQRVRRVLFLQGRLCVWPEIRGCVPRDTDLRHARFLPDGILAFFEKPPNRNGARDTGRRIG